MSRQNSMDVSSLEVTLNGSQIEINPFGNGTKPFDDVKVLLVRGQDGAALAPHNWLCTIFADNWSNTTDANGYYTNTVTLSTPINANYKAIIDSWVASNADNPNEQRAAYNMCNEFYFPSGEATTSMTVKAKTKPTVTFYVWVLGFKNNN